MVGGESSEGADGSAVPGAETAVVVWLSPAAAGPGDHDLLDDVERAALGRLRRPADRDRYVAAHAHRRRLVAAHLGVPARHVRFTPAACPLCGGPHGRPVVAGGGVEVSLSRTSDLVAVALAPAVVGVDVEALDRAVGIRDLESALHPAERATVPDRTAALRLWVRKEAYLKGRGTGLGVDPAGVDVSTDPPGWRIVDVAAGPAHLAAVAVMVGPTGGRGSPSAAPAAPAGTVRLTTYGPTAPSLRARPAPTGP